MRFRPAAPGAPVGRIRKSAAKKRCAAQAEYTRLAAQAYSPSDAMSQAKIGLDGTQKVQRLDANSKTRISQSADPDAETAPRGKRICCEGGVVSSRFFPVVGDLAALPHAAGSFGLRLRAPGLAAAAAPAVRPALLLTRGMRLPRRGVGSGDGPSGLTGSGGLAGSWCRLSGESQAARWCWIGWSGMWMSCCMQQVIASPS